MRKSDVETHAEGYYGPQLPAVNVKAYSYARGLSAETFGCSEKDYERAVEFAFESAQTCFWEEVQGWANECFPDYSVKVYSAGRSGGWVVVEGLPLIESWDAIILGRWSRFARMCQAEVEYLSKAETVREDIEANEWAKPGSELFNFYELADGHSKSIPDLKAAAVAAGFGPVVR